MLLKPVIAMRRKFSYIAAYYYRVPLQVRERLLFSNGDSYPICPRCGNTADREYMRFCDQCGQRLAWNVFDSAQIISAPRRSELLPKRLSTKFHLRLEGECDEYATGRKHI